MTEKSLPQPSSPHVKGRSFTPYAVIWTTAAGLSLLYLVLLATQPTLVAHYLGAGAESPQATEAQKAVDEAVAEVRTLRGTLDQFRSELFEIRAQVSSQTESTRGLSDKVAALEMDRDDPERAARLAAEETKAKETAVKEAAAKEAAAKKAAKEVAAKEAKEAKKLAASKQALETGSVAQPATGTITFGPPTVTPAAADPAAGDLVGVAIATGPSVDSLRLSWTLLNERHGESLRAFEPRYTTDISGSEQSYDLVVGPVASVDEAKRLCQELAVKATPCRVSRFTGDAL
ncbi:MAG: hypothetical protein AB7S70_16565 [Hyphomicrobium sp.]